MHVKGCYFQSRPTTRDFFPAIRDQETTMIINALTANFHTSTRLITNTEARLHHSKDVMSVLPISRLTNGFIYLFGYPCSNRP